jgi:hypothetical protein
MTRKMRGARLKAKASAFAFCFLDKIATILGAACRDHPAVFYVTFFKLSDGRSIN